MDDWYGRPSLIKCGVCPCIVPSWVILRPNGSVSPGRLLGRTRVGLIFLLPYHICIYIFLRKQRVSYSLLRRSPKEPR